MKQRELDDMKKLYKKWSTEDIVRAITFEKDNYLADAITLLNNELNDRDISQLDIDRIRAEVKVEISNDIKAVSGIKGFLLIFILGIALRSLSMLLSGFSLFKSHPSVVSFVICFSVIVASLYGMYAFILLVLKKSNAPKHAANWLSCLIILAIFISVANYFTSGITSRDMPHSDT